MVSALQYAATALSPEPDSQVAETISLMRDYVAEDATHDLLLREAAEAAVGITNPYDLAHGVFDRTQRRLRFKVDNDVLNHFRPSLTGLSSLVADNTIEILIRPIDVVLMSEQSGDRILGDCDDHAMFAACLCLCLEKLGHPVSNVKFVTVAAEAGSSDFSHVYAQADFGFGSAKKTIPLDVSHGQYAGWEVPATEVTRRQEHLVSGISGYIVALATFAAIGFLYFNKGSF